MEIVGTLKEIYDSRTSEMYLKCSVINKLSKLLWNWHNLLFANKNNIQKYHEEKKALLKDTGKKAMRFQKKSNGTMVYFCQTQYEKCPLDLPNKKLSMSLERAVLIK